MNVEQIQAHLMDTAREGCVAGLLRDGSVMPVCIGYTGENVEGVAVCAAMPLPMAERDETIRFMALVSELFETFVTINEMWYNTGECLPSEDLNRKEGVLVTLIHNGKTIDQDVLPFDRQDGKIVAGKWWSTLPGEFTATRPPGSMFPPRE
jgi:hypothetical protein